jgi:hypothetical protein
VANGKRRGIHRAEGFADADMRRFACTFGDRVLEDVWQCFYDREEKYERLRRIKGQLDPDGLFFCRSVFLETLIDASGLKPARYA